jgi:WD40 repeat protein
MTVGGLDANEAGREPEPGFYRLSVSGNRVATAAGAAGTAVWRLGGLPPPPLAPRPAFVIPGRSYAVAFHGNLLAVGRGNSFVLMDTGKDCPSMPRQPCRLAAPGRPHSVVPVEDMAMAEYDGRLLLATTGFRAGMGSFSLWDITDARRDHEVVHLATRPTNVKGALALALAIAPGKMPLLALAASDGKARVWDVSHPRNPKGIEIARAHGNENQPVDAVAFSPDGKLLASGGLDQQVVLWEVTQEDGYLVRATPGNLYQSQAITALAFSPGGKTLAVGDGTGSTCLYDVASRQQVGGRSCLPGHLLSQKHKGVSGLAFTEGAGGLRLISAGIGQPITAWDSILWSRSENGATDEALRRDVCAMAGRSLTEPEWSAIFDPAPLVGGYRETCSE